MSGLEVLLKLDQIDEFTVLQPVGASASHLCNQEYAAACMEGSGLWGLGTIENLSNDETVALKDSVAKLSIEAGDAIFCIVAEQDANIEACTALPLVLPHQIAKTDIAALTKVIQKDRT